MADPKRTTWLVYDHRDGKWLREYNHPTNYVDEANDFTREEAEKRVADVAGQPWINGRPPRVMVPDARDEYAHLGLEGQAKAMWKLVEAAIAQMAADRKAVAPKSEPVRAYRTAGGATLAVLDDTQDPNEAIGYRAECGGCDWTRHIHHDITQFLDAVAARIAGVDEGNRYESVRELIGVRVLPNGEE